MKNSILIVDDSEDTRELFKATLEAEGFAVFEAADGEKALELLLSNQHFSLMLLDLSMPHMTGYELLETMQRQDIRRSMPIMLVSAAGNLNKILVPENVIDTLKKPFFYPELIFKIKEVHGLRPEMGADIAPH